MYRYWSYEDKSENFAKRLKKLRSAEGITQGQLAEALCISRSCISNYENKTRYPDYETIKQMADYFGVFVDYLVGTSDSIEVPIKKENIKDYDDILKRVSSSGDKIDLSGIPLNKKLAIIEFSDYVINSGRK
ncbi:MAG: helix-turn-helix transcriptional regulator [Ruminococcaceae bacterium]|nr:helix-turn-helix transcriptional regulator [Oscillospiraceae bacterium]